MPRTAAADDVDNPTEPYDAAKAEAKVAEWDAHAERMADHFENKGRKFRPK
jgi:cytochrome c556